MVRRIGLPISVTTFVLVAAAFAPPVARAQSSVPSAEGKEVRVTLLDGTTRTGRLVAMSSSEVILQRARTFPLGAVRKVERVSHGRRYGFYIGLLAVPTMMVLQRPLDLGNDWVLGFMAAGVGAGMGIGALVQAVNESRSPIYVAPGSSAAITFAPILSSQQHGVALVARW